MRKVFLAAVLVLMASGAQAATLNVIGGQLHGAFGVDVGGSLYDVEFVDGTCLALFSGCDSPANFPFTFADSASALSASQALLDQVFLDVFGGNFDSDPSLTSGCDYFDECIVLTPFAIFQSADTIYTVDAHNLAPGLEDDFALLDLYFTPKDYYNTGNAPWLWNDHNGYPTPWMDFNVYARWSLVPEPSTALLLGLGLAGIAARRRM